MSAYPSTTNGGPFKTSITPVTKTRNKLSESGNVHGTSLTDKTAFRITVKHRLITETQFDFLKSFFTTNENADNTIPANDGDTYDFWYESDYSFVPRSSNRWDVQCTILANRQ